MKNNGSKIIFIMICSLVIAGCGQKDKMAESAENNVSAEADGTEIIEKNSLQTAEPADIPEQFNETINGVNFALKPEIPENLDLAGIKRSTAEKQVPDLEQVISITAENRTVEKESKDKTEGENGVIYDSYYAKYSDGSMVSANTTLTYATPFFEKIHNAFRLEEAGKYSKSELAFQSPENCFQEIQKSLNQFGYESDGFHYDYYALDYQTMQQEEVQLDKSGEVLGTKSEWSADDDCYYFYMEQIQEGIPVFYGEQDFPADSLENRPIQAVYSGDGLERLDVYKLYQFHTEDERVSLKDFGDIAQKVADKYGNILTGAEYTVKRAKLYQMPVKAADGTYEVKVIWFFETSEKGVDSETGENFEYSVYTCIDAETGEEVTI